MIKRFLQALFAICLMSISVNAAVPAASITEYRIPMQKVELYNSTKDEWIVLCNTNYTLTLKGSDATNTAIGNMPTVDNLQLTFGTYTQMRVTVGNVFYVHACEDGGQCTDGVAANLAAATGAGPGSLTQITMDFTNGTVDGVLTAAQTGTMTYPAAGRTTTSLEILYQITSFTLDESSSPKSFSVNFNLTNALAEMAGPTIAVGAPLVDISVE